MDSEKQRWFDENGFRMMRCEEMAEEILTKMNEVF